MALTASAACFLSCGVPLSAADKPPVTFAATSHWNVNYADDSCRLARAFSDGKDEIILIFDQFEPGPLMYGTIAGSPFRGLAGRKVTVRFGPDGGEVTIPELMAADFGKYGPTVLTGAMALTTSGTEAGDPVTPPYSNNPTPEQERAINWLEITRVSRAPVRLALGPMDKTMTAMRKCTDELLKLWGVDATAHKSLTRKAQPSGNPATWVTGNDYPRDLIAKGVQGVIQFRLSIDAQGKVSDCRIQQSTRPAEFDRRVCQIMAKRGRFDPALDAAGNPISSYWRSSFRFVID